MPISAILLIDGSNFYHAMRDDGYVDFDVGEFKELFDLLSKRFELRKIYYYDATKHWEKDKHGFTKQQAFHERLKRTHSKLTLRTRKLRYMVNITKGDVEASADRVGIVDACRDKLMDFLYDLKLIRLTKEKGVDVLLVVDAIEEVRAKTVETIILLSGDADFVPAVHLIKEYGLKTVNLHAYSGSSKELRDACDEHIRIDFGSDGLILRGRGY